MSTKVGVIKEGPIDLSLVSALLQKIATSEGLTWPIDPDDIDETYQIRKRGHGGVLENVRNIVDILSKRNTDYAFFVIVLDFKKTKHVQKEISQLIRAHQNFLVGIAIQEIEAWWLADRPSTLGWLKLANTDIASTSYKEGAYSPEKDETPKQTLDELIALSESIDEFYGKGNHNLAEDFSNIWRESADLNLIATLCPKGFKPFREKAKSEFRRILRNQS